MRELTPTEQAYPWVRFPILTREQQAKRDALDYLIDDPGLGLRRQSHGVTVGGKIRVRNHKGLIASIEQALDGGVLLPPIHVYYGRFSEHVPSVWHLWDGCHRVYAAMLRGEKGVYAHNSPRTPIEGPIVWLDLQDIGLSAADLESTFGEPFKPEWEWRDDPRRAALGLPVAPSPVTQAA